MYKKLDSQVMIVCFRFTSLLVMDSLKFTPNSDTIFIVKSIDDNLQNKKIIDFFEKNHQNVELLEFNNLSNIKQKKFEYLIIDDYFVKQKLIDVDFISKILPFLDAAGYLLILGESYDDFNEVKRELFLCGFIKFEEINFDERIKLYKSTLTQIPIGSSKKLESDSIWKIEDESSDFNMIDPESLLLEEDFKIPQKVNCGTKALSGQAKKACKNCTCGLAEELEKEEGHGNVDSTFKPSCGNCYLGDPFRCSACPYKGLPPFKPGEKIVFRE